MPNIMIIEEKEIFSDTNFMHSINARKCDRKICLHIL